MVSRSQIDRVPSFKELMNPTLDALHALGGSSAIGELDRKVIGTLALPESVNTILHKNGPQTEVEYRLAWARTYLKRFGIIDNSQRGVWALTEQGHIKLSIDPNEVATYVRGGIQVRQGVQLSDGEPEDDDGSDEWRDVLIDTLKEMSPDAFERLCQRVLRESGFIEVTVTGQSGDGGIDGNGVIRLAGLISFPVLFQCKRYNGNVGAGVVRDFRGAMQGRADKGMIITTGGFTREAYQEATRDGAPPIDLIDGQLLAEKMKELQLGVATRTVEVVEVNTTWFESI